MPLSREPLLIVPVLDRRQHRRILTIRNCAIAMLSVALVLASISIYSKSHKVSAGGLDRINSTQVTAPNEHKIDIVQEGSTDQVPSDPMLAAPTGVANVAMTTTTTILASLPAAPTASPHPAQGTTIVGDGKGLTVARGSKASNTQQPVLAGGIFKGQ